VQSLLSGPVRDQAIFGLVGQWQDYGIEQEELIASISNDGTRIQARKRQIWAVMRREPGRARELMENADLPEHERQQLEATFDQMNRSR